jgi:hypothetical protein
MIYHIFCIASKTFLFYIQEIIAFLMKKGECSGVSLRRRGVCRFIRAINNKRISFGVGIIILSFHSHRLQVSNGFIWINLILALLLPHNSGETSDRVSHQFDQTVLRVIGGCQSDGFAGLGDAHLRGKCIREVPVRSQLLVPKGFY